MQKFPEVEKAKELLTEAIDWSVVRWLREKRRVRKAADRANGLLDRLSAETRERWPADLQDAYRKLAAGHPPAMAAALLATARQSHRADAEAHRLRMEAESTFDDAERQLSTRLAREGCRKAISSWELHENALRLAERSVKNNH